jgi:multisubunit Na+/H+ antiporter MnhG subunit
LVASIGVHAAIAVCVLPCLLWFYGFHYSLHQDLAGSALSGRLAITLGEAFPNYSIYFPPAEQAWFSLAARLAEGTGSRLDSVVVLMTGGAVLFSGGLAYRIRQQTVGASPLFLLLSVAILLILPISFKNMFGLREHLIALGLWPYLVLRVSDPDGTRIGWRLRLVVGLWVGATLLFKYLYSIVVFLVEIADALVQRRPALLFRIENVVAGAVVALYLFCWLVLDPSQRTAIGAVKSAIDANLAEPGANWLHAGKNLYFAVIVLLLSLISRLPMRVMALGLALVIGSIIAAWAQARWYTHHVFPIVLAYIAWWWMAGRGLRWWGHLILAMYLLAPISREYLSTASYQEAVKELDLAFDRAGHSVTAKRVGILTMHPSPYNEYLAAQGAVRWNSSMNNAYVAAELKSFDKPENAQIPPPPVKLKDPGRRMLHDEMLRLWEDMPPDVLILDHSTRWPLRYVDVEWRHVFSEDPRFNAILQRYRPVLKHKGDRLEFTYLVRAP